MSIINVKEICSEYCIDENDVQNLSNEIVEKLENDEKVILDFGDVDTVLTAFFNGLLAELFEKYNSQIIYESINFTENTPNSVKHRYLKSFENAKRFFDTPKEVQNRTRERVNKIFNREIDLDEPLSASG